MTAKSSTISENGTIVEDAEFDWDSQLQGYVLSSFYYGYIATQILGGYLSAKFGGKIIFGISIATTSTLTLLTPLCASLNVYLLLAVRILEGISEVTFANFLITFVKLNTLPPGRLLSLHALHPVEMGATGRTQPHGYNRLLRQQHWHRRLYARQCSSGGRPRLAVDLLLLRNSRHLLDDPLVAGDLLQSGARQAHQR